VTPAQDDLSDLRDAFRAGDGMDVGCAPTTRAIHSRLPRGGGGAAGESQWRTCRGTSSHVHYRRLTDRDSRGRPQRDLGPPRSSPSCFSLTK
jgi:hypothetical protein